MILIVDSGGTKADWKVVSPDGIEQLYETSGYSPLLHEENMLLDNIHQLPLNTAQLSAVYYYGSGVHAVSVQEKLSRFLRQHLGIDTIGVASDLLGACRATAGNNPGIVSILGTGASTCKYNGTEIIDQIPSLGYILGDEGSGYALGKRIVKAYLYREMPPDLLSLFESVYHLDKKSVLENVYHSPSANAFIASIANFAVENKQHSYIRALIREEMDEFINRHLLKYKDVQQNPCHFVGSLAWLLQDEISIIMSEYRLNCGLFVRKPIDRLAAYHRQ